MFDDFSAASNYAKLSAKFLIGKLKANTDDAISCIKLLSNSLIRKFSLWSQHNSIKESYDTNRIVCNSLKAY